VHSSFSLPGRSPPPGAVGFEIPFFPPLPLRASGLMEDTAYESPASQECALSVEGFFFLPFFAIMKRVTSSSASLFQRPSHCLLVHFLGSFTRRDLVPHALDRGRFFFFTSLFPRRKIETISVLSSTDFALVCAPVSSREHTRPLDL